MPLLHLRGARNRYGGPPQPNWIRNHILGRSPPAPEHRSEATQFLLVWKRLGDPYVDQALDEELRQRRVNREPKRA
jgi:hypothetical protein